MFKAVVIFVSQINTCVTCYENPFQVLSLNLNFIIMFRYNGWNENVSSRCDFPCGREKISGICGKVNEMRSYHSRLSIKVRFTGRDAIDFSLLRFKTDGGEWIYIYIHIYVFLLCQTIATVKGIHERGYFSFMSKSNAFIKWIAAKTFVPPFDGRWKNYRV